MIVLASATARAHLGAHVDLADFMARFDRPSYDVGSRGDSSRPRTPEAAGGEAGVGNSMIMIQNWFTELAERVGNGN